MKYEKPSQNYWLPWKQDPVLLEQRQGRWQWYWFLLSLAVMFLLLIILGNIEETLTKTIADVTQTNNLYATYTNNKNAILLKENAYSFSSFLSVGIILTLITIILLRIHRYKWQFGLTYNVPIKWSAFFKAAGALGVVSIIGISYFILSGSPDFKIATITPNIIPWLCLGIFVIFIQTLGEEVFIRGYLLRIIGAIMPYRMIAVALVGLFFVLLHSSNPDVNADLWYSMIVFSMQEIVIFWVLFRTQSVMATWGIHFMNNIAALSLNIQPGWTNEIALFVYTDPVWSAGESRLLDPMSYVSNILAIAIFIFLITWNRSPFYLAPAKR